MDVIGLHCNYDFVYKCNKKNPIRLNPDPAGFQASDIRIRYPAENQYQSISNCEKNLAVYNAF